MGKNSLHTGTSDFSELLSNGKIYTVPRFQRDYSWTEEEWEDLWYDILGLEEEQSHYMGYLVLQSDNRENYIIIDGQQRLATLSIFALAIIKNIDDLIQKNIEPEKNAERIKELRNRFLGYKDPSSLKASSKLFLNRNNDDFYQSFLLQLREPRSRSRLKPSEKLLWRAFEYFYKVIREKELSSGAELAKFLNNQVAKSLTFTTIDVNDDVNAYKIFETLNARGVKLSTTDLLKNYLFSIVVRGGDLDLDHADSQWLRINETLESTEFPTYLRHYWNSCHPLETKRGLFKTIKKEVNAPEKAFDLLDKLETSAAMYIAFSNPADEIWKEKKQRQSIRELTLFRVKQCYPLLLVAYDKLDTNEFTKLLRMCSIISFRYNIIAGRNPNILEKAYNKAAIKVSREDINTASSVFNELKSEVYISDEDFSNAFATKIIYSKSTRDKKLIRYILCSIENQLKPAEYDFEDAKFTIEHVLPENPKSEWEAFFNEEEQDNYTYRLGNYTLLETKKNKDCGNKLYADKLSLYQTSNYKLTSEDTIYDGWTPNTLRKRQEKLAKIATAIWKIDY